MIRCAPAVQMRINISSVEHFETCDENLVNAFRCVANVGIDMKKMSVIIRKAGHAVSGSDCQSLSGPDQYFPQLCDYPDACARKKFLDAVTDDFLYGPDDGTELEASVDEVRYYTEVQNWSSQEWIALLKKCATMAPNFSTHNVHS